MDKNTTLIIVAVLVGIIFVGPSVLQAGSDAFKGLGDWVREGFETDTSDTDFWNFTGTQETTGFFQISGVVYYVDGSKREFKADTFSILPLSIYDETDKEVAKIVFNIWIQLTFDGQLTHWDTTNLYWSAVDGLETVENGNFAKSGSTWTSGEEKNIFSIVIEAGDIEQILHQEAPYTLRTKATCQLNAEFSDGTTEYEEAEATTTWDFTYETDHIKGLKMTITTGQF